MKLTISKLKNCNTIADLENLGIGNVDYDIGPRGGSLGFSPDSIKEAIGIKTNLLPNKVGAYVNYLGGGVRGSICISNYNSDVYNMSRKQRLLDELLKACVRAYKSAEDEMGMNDDSIDGETNWEAQATKEARKHRIKRSY